jgi:biopolymer transport protein ExbB
LTAVRQQYQQTQRLLDTHTLDLTNLRNEIKGREKEATYLSETLFGEYMRNFESRLHIAEIQRYKNILETARLASENRTLPQREVYEAQLALLSVSLERIEDVLGGTRFHGTAVDSTGLVKNGAFVLVGPAAIFRSHDGKVVGTVEQRLGSLEPAVISFGDPLDAAAAEELITEGTGRFPFDPTRGNAHKIERTQETLIEHIKKGGPVMYPIFGLAGAALLVALFKWSSMAFIRIPSQKKIRALLNAVAERNKSLAVQKAKAMGGPVGRMLQVGTEHIEEPRELIEEVMYEKILSTRLRLQRFLSFIAVSAASAPLLGLLGTVTGIINTFKLITVFGSGDVKTLSGGISEALITTEFGLIVAIPSLLLHAFLSRKARGVVNQMEKAAVALVNQVGKTPFRKGDEAEITERETFRTFDRTGSTESRRVWPDAGESVEAFMDPHVISADRNSTVREAIGKMQDTDVDEQPDTLFVVGEHGTYIGHISIEALLTQPEYARLGSLHEMKSLSVRLDTHRSEVDNLFNEHDLVTIAVLNREDKLVGRVTRNGNRRSQGGEV